MKLICYQLKIGGYNFKTFYVIIRVNTREKSVAITQNNMIKLPNMTLKDIKTQKRSGYKTSKHGSIEQP